MDQENQDKAAPAGATQISREALGEFVISLIQAFLRTGYYLPEHPESKRAKEGLHEEFQKLVRDSGEITFLVREEGALRNIYIEGIGEEALRLTGLMTRGMAETYNPRFAGFMERKELISLSLSSRMNPEEFSLFVDVMSEPSLLDMREHAAKEKFVAYIRERGISHISFVFNEDFITAQRNLPWRACMALSRLRKDFTMIPIFRNLEKEQLAEVRREVLAEIMRPLTSPDLAYAFLMNIDLAATGDLSEAEAEDEVLLVMNDDVLMEVASIFTGDASGREIKYREALPEKKFSRMLYKMATRLIRTDRHEAKERLEEMFTAGLLSMEDLPPDVKEVVMTIQMTVSLIGQRDKYMKHLDKAEDPEEYSKRAHTLARTIPYLLERGRCLEASMITERLAAHGREQSARAVIALETLAWLAKGDALNNAREAFMAVSKEERIYLGRIFSLMGRWAVPHLWRIVGETDDLWRRKQAAEILFEIGPEATASLVYEMERGALSQDTLATIIKVLGECSEDSLKSAVVRAVEKSAWDRDPEIRREAITALAKLDPGGNLELFLKSLEDLDSRVKKNAVRALGFTGSLGAVDPLLALVPLAADSDLEEDHGLAASAVDSLGRLYGPCPEAREKILSTLVEPAEGEYFKGKLKRLVGGARLPTAFLMSLAEAMGRVGGDPGRRVLSRMVRDREQAVSRKAADALARLDNSRTADTASGGSEEE